MKEHALNIQHDVRKHAQSLHVFSMLCCLRLLPQYPPKPYSVTIVRKAVIRLEHALELHRYITTRMSLLFARNE